jgi:hypothetical protein
MYGDHNAQMSLPRRCVSAGALVRNYGAQLWRPLRETNPYLRRRADPISKHINSLGTNKNLVTDQKRLRRRRPAAIYCYSMQLVLPRVSC